MAQTPHKVIVLAGRRYRDDAPVRAALRPHLASHSGATLVCSAAAGADLIALDLARELGMDFRIVLPSSQEEFCKTSVRDRGESWRDRFNTVLSTTPKAAIIRVDPGTNDPFAVATNAILDQGLRLAGDPRAVLAVVVWNGKRHSKDPDYTDAFRDGAVNRGFQVVEVRVAE